MLVVYERIAELAGKHDHVLTRAQLHKIGVTDQRIKTLVRKSRCGSSDNAAYISSVRHHRRGGRRRGRHSWRAGTTRGLTERVRCCGGGSRAWTRSRCISA
jgi:hypothetical protein